MLNDCGVKACCLKKKVNDMHKDKTLGCIRCTTKTTTYYCLCVFLQFLVVIVSVCLFKQVREEALLEKKILMILYTF